MPAMTCGSLLPGRPTRLRPRRNTAPGSPHGRQSSSPGPAPKQPPSGGGRNRRRTCGAARSCPAGPGRSSGPDRRTDPLIPGIKPGPELHDGPAGWPVRKSLTQQIENHGAQDSDRQPPQSRPYFLRVEVDGCHDLGRLRVAQHRPPPARLPGPGRQRDEQRLLDRPELRPHSVCHASHYTPACRAGREGQHVHDHDGTVRGLKFPDVRCR